jgi:2-isopropylmalate synthase
MEPILIYDTTLRDGTQGKISTFSADEKLKIAKRLDEMGIHYIEGGWPGIQSTGHAFSIWPNAEIQDMPESRPSVPPANRASRPPTIPNLNAIAEKRQPTVAIFGKSWPLHVESIMDNTLEENLDMMPTALCLSQSHGREVIYDAEHFFDGFKDAQDYALETLHGRN